MLSINASLLARSRSMALGALAVIAILALGSRVHAQCTDGWVPGAAYPGLDGWAYESVNWDPDGDGPEPEMLVIWGEFDVIGGVAAHNVAAWDGNSWHALGAGFGWRSTDGAIVGGESYWWARLAVVGTELYAAVYEYHSSPFRPGGYGGTSIQRWNGVEWEWITDFGGRSGGLDALCAFNGELVITGDFSRVANGPPGNIARWNGHQWLPLGAGPSDEIDGQAYQLLVHDGRLIIAGRFAKVGGVPVRNIAAWDGQSWQPLGSGFGGSVGSLAIYHNELVAAGSFDATTGDPEHIARWDGARWQPLASGIQTVGFGSIQSVTPFRDELIVTGGFDQAGGVPAPGAAVWNGSEWSVWNSGMASAHVVGVCQGSVLGSGRLPTPRGPLWVPLARWDGSAWRLFEDGLNTPLSTLTSFRGELIGAFEHGYGFNGSCNTPLSGKLARWDGHCWNPLDVRAEHDYGRVFAMTTHGSDLLVGGAFADMNGVPAVNIARWDGAQWHALGAGLGVPDGGSYSGVNALTTYNGHLIAGGYFRTTGPRPVERIARWSGTQWEPMGSGFPGFAYPIVSVAALIVHNGELYAGGHFIQNGQQFGVARWNPQGNSWVPLPPLATDYDYVFALAVNRNELVAGGYTDDGTLRPLIARWDRNGWRPLGELGGGGYEHYVHVQSLAVYGPDLIAGGTFSKADGAPVHNIARWDGTRWHRVGLGVRNSEFGPHPYYGSASVDALALHRGTLAVGGSFFFAGDHPSANFAQWRCTPCPADFDASGNVGVQDVFDFLAVYLLRDPRADFNESGSVSPADLFDFLGSYFAGCA